MRALQEDAATGAPSAYGEEGDESTMLAQLSADGVAQQLAAKTQLLAALRLRLRSRVRELEILYEQSGRAAPSEATTPGAARNLEMLRRVLVALDAEERRTSAFDDAATRAGGRGALPFYEMGPTPHLRATPQSKPRPQFVPDTSRTWSIGGNSITMIGL